MSMPSIESPIRRKALDDISSLSGPFNCSVNASVVSRYNINTL